MAIHIPSKWMALESGMAGITEFRPKERGADSEKITINLGYVDLGHIDLMVREGFYSNRTDFIRLSATSSASTPTPSSAASRTTRWISACAVTRAKILSG